MSKRIWRAIASLAILTLTISGSAVIAGAQGSYDERPSWCDLPSEQLSDGSAAVCAGFDGDNSGGDNSDDARPDWCNLPAWQLGADSAAICDGFDDGDAHCHDTYYPLPTSYPLPATPAHCHDHGDDVDHAPVLPSWCSLPAEMLGDDSRATCGYPAMVQDNLPSWCSLPIDMLGPGSRARCGV